MPSKKEHIEDIYPLSPLQQGMLFDSLRGLGPGIYLEQLVWHHHAEAYHLPFPDNYFDSCRCERMFQHLALPESALAEMVRVTKANGWVVTSDADHATWSTDTPEIDIERRLAGFFCESQQRNGYAGRQLYGMFKNCELSAIGIEPSSIFVTDYETCREVFCLNKVEEEAVEAGVVSAQEIERWRDSLEGADREGRFFTGSNLVMVFGQKPARQEVACSLSRRPRPRTSA